MIQTYLPLQPDIEEFANTVERGESITAGNSFRSFLTTLGQLLLSFKEMVQEGFCWFPRLMRWNTSERWLRYFGMTQADIIISWKRFGILRQRQYIEQKV